VSRSRRHTPIFGHTTAESEKDDKRKANRRLRRKARAGQLDVRLREVSDVWTFEKDGKRYDKDASPDEMRK
jgi:outer membrane cobalamin receptor